MPVLAATTLAHRMLAARTLALRIGRLTSIAIGCCLLIVISVQGYKNAMRNTADLQTTAQYLMTISQFSYSALGPCVVMLRFVSLRWLHAAWRAWAFFFIAAVALIPWAWIEPLFVQTLGFALAAIVISGILSLLVFSGAQSKAPQGTAPE